MSKTIDVDVVSAEESIFSGKAKYVSLPGEQGSLGVYPGHTPLLTNLVGGGEVRITLENDKVETIFIRGGMLEVQPTKVVVLADTAIRAANIDAAKLAQARKEAEAAIAQAKSDIDLAAAKAELAAVVAEIRTVEKLRNKK